MERATSLSHLKVSFNCTISESCNYNALHVRASLHCSAMYFHLIHQYIINANVWWSLHCSWIPSLMIYLWRWEKDNERTVGNSKRFVFIIFFLSFFLSPACAKWFHIYRVKSLTLLPLPAHTQVNFCSCPSRGVGNNICFFFSDASEFPNSDEEAAAPDGKWRVEAAWQWFVLFYTQCYRRVRACRLEWWKHKAATETTLFLLSQTQRSPRPLNHQTKSIFLVYSGTFTILSELAVNENRW